MLTIIVVLAALGLGVVFFLTANESEGKRQRALKSLAEILESKVEPIVGEKNSYRLEFVYNGKKFIYEDIEDSSFRGRVAHWGVLRLPMDFNFTMNFSERELGTVKESVQSFSDLRNPWMHNIGKVISPPALQSFIIYSSNNNLATLLLADEESLKIFDSFKVMDSRGHPVMPLVFLEGVLVLKFHSGDGLKPALVTIYNNASSIEGYLNKMAHVVDKATALYKEMKARNLP